MKFSLAKTLLYKHTPALLLSSLVLSGCSSMLMDEDNISAEPENFFQPVEQNIDPIAPMVLRVMGYGAVNERSKLSKSRKRLMAIRASKLDAYRTMAERVYGTSIQGSTTVRDLVVHNDRFRSFVDTFIHGARVVSSDVMPDGSVETVLEMVVDQGFRNCIQTSQSERFNVDCRAPLASGESKFANNQRERIRSEAQTPESGFYFIE